VIVEVELVSDGSFSVESVVDRKAIALAPVYARCKGSAAEVSVNDGELENESGDGMPL
jgi:hypothetical protein